MDRDKDSAQVARLEVVETGRRRRWCEDEKLKIVLESSRVPRQVAAKMRRHGVSRSLLLRWRRLFRPERTEASTGQMGSVPAMVVPDLELRLVKPGQRRDDRDRVRSQGSDADHRRGRRGDAEGNGRGAG